ncbi:MAG: DUF1444 family protein [Phycisphaerales bacterium]|nr:DUF1444 family protein [Phycisphaerales bacterium]
MARMPHEPEAFCEAVMALMSRLSPERNVELAGTFEVLIDGRHLALENLYRMVLNDPDRGVEIVEQFLDHLLEGEEAASVPLPFEVARPRIMPRIQPESIFQHLDAQLVAHQPFVNDTVVLYVIDMPHLTVSITVEQMLKWGVDLEEIDRTARRNLGAYSDELKLRIIEAGSGGKAAIFQENDGYDASRLLLGSLHGRLAPVLGSNFLVAAPARDAFLAVTADPAEFAEKVHSRVEIDYKRLPYPITDRFFIVTMDGIAGTTAA